jgi:hypothetical protein
LLFKTRWQAILLGKTRRKVASALGVPTTNSFLVIRIPISVVAVVTVIVIMLVVALSMAVALTVPLGEREVS